MLKQEKEEDPEIDYKADQKFSEHMKDATEAVSDFATRKTLKQQREYLPVFAVRNEVKFCVLYQFIDTELFGSYMDVSYFILGQIPD